MSPTMNLDCGLCLVRNWSRDDQESLLEHADNLSVARNVGERFPHPYTAADADQWFSLLEDMAEPTHWAVEVDGLAVGGIGVELGRGEYAKSGRFGYWLGEVYWGRGIMTAAVCTTSDYVLSHYGLVRLEAPVFQWNPASMRVLEKCGFDREGILRRSIIKNGEVIDTVLFAKVI